MSTKIYYAYKFSGNLSELFDELDVLRADWIDNVVDTFKFMKKKFETGELDKEQYPEEAEAFGDMLKFMDFLEKKIRGGKNNFLNIDCSIVVYPFKARTQLIQC